MVAARGAAAGCARLLGAALVVPPGATGDVDTDLHAKARAAVDAIERGARRVVVHVGAPDEAAHRRDAGAKAQALEALDAALLAPLSDAVAACGGTLAVCPDHGTDPLDGTHDAGAVPALRWGRGVAPAGPRPDDRGAQRRGAGAARDVAAARRRASGGGGVIARVVIGGTSSGAGKTTVATGPAGRARRARPAPDRLQGRPGLHRPQLPRARQRPPRAQPRRLPLRARSASQPLFRHGSAGADIAVVEGVMGLYDGASGRGELASTAHVAKLLRAPVVLVLDAAAIARSAAAIVHGYAGYDPEVDVAGVILNRVGSEGHAAAAARGASSRSACPCSACCAATTPSRRPSATSASCRWPSASRARARR